LKAVKVREIRKNIQKSAIIHDPQGPGPAAPAPTVPRFLSRFCGRKQ